MVCGKSDDYESGHLDKGTVYEEYSWYPPSDCSTSTKQTGQYRVRLETSAEKSPNENYDQIADKKKWFIKSYFENEPESLLDRQNCGWADSDGVPYLRQAEYKIQQGSGETNEVGVYDFVNPVPDESDSKLDDWLGVALSIAGSAVGGYVGAGGAEVVKAVMPDFTNDYYSESSPNNKLTGDWQFPTKDEFPSKPCESAGVRITVDTNTGAGAQHETEVYNRFTFNYATIDETYCPCNGGDPLRWYSKTTFNAYNKCEWETIA